MLTKAKLDRYSDVLIWALKTARKEKYRRRDIVLVRYDLPALKMAEIVQGKLLDMGLNPVLRANNRFMAMITSERLLEYVKRFNARVVLRNTFRTVKLARKLVPSGRRARERRGKKAGFPGSGYVDIARMLDEYYRLRRIDEQGLPEAAVLDELGLRDVSRALHGVG